MTMILKDLKRLVDKKKYKIKNYPNYIKHQQCKSCAIDNFCK